MAIVRTAALSVLLAAGIPSTAAAGPVEANLEAVGHTDLGEAARFGDVAVVGTTAVVAAEAAPGAGSPCARPSARVVDVKDPRRPRVVSVISLPAGTAAADVDATSLATEAFTGDLLSIAVGATPCGRAADAGVYHYDLTDPANPRMLARTPGPHAISIGPREGGGALAVTLDGSNAVAVYDLTDPSRPAALGRWPVPGATPAPGCLAARPVSASLHDGGQAALLVLSDGRIYDLDLSDPASLSGAGGEQASATQATFGTVLPLGRRTVAIVADEGACPGGAGTRGLRLFELDRGAAPREIEGVSYPSPASPGRLVASGELAYVAWHADGLRVVDLGAVPPRTVAQFIPPAADVVGVALLPEHIVVTDRASGLHVLVRPDEAGGRSSFWSDLVGLLPYLGFAGIMAAVFVIPRLAMGRAPAGTSVPSPTPARVPRRRA